MKKNTKIFVGVLAAVLLLSASVAYALSDTANEAAISGKEQVKDVVSVNDESVPLTEAIEASSRASTDAYGFSVSELSPVGIQAADAQMIARDTAIETAAKHLENMDIILPPKLRERRSGQVLTHLSWSPRSRDRQNDAGCSVMAIVGRSWRRPARFTGRSRFAPCRFGHGRRCVHGRAS